MERLSEPTSRYPHLTVSVGTVLVTLVAVFALVGCFDSGAVEDGDAGMPDSDDAVSHDTDATDTAPDAGSSDVDDTEPDADVEPLECDSHGDVDSCGDNTTCSWFESIGCVDSGELLDDPGDLDGPVAGTYTQGTATVGDHPAVPAGDYSTRLAVVEIDGELSGSLHLDDPDRPAHGYRIAGDRGDDGLIDLTLSDVQCLDKDDTDFCDELSELETSFQTVGTFDDEFLFTRAGSTSSDVDFDAFIGMTQEPHGGFKPSSVSPDDVKPRGDIVGEWNGDIQLLSDKFTTRFAYCTFEFRVPEDNGGTEAGESPELVGVDCPNSEFFGEELQEQLPVDVHVGETEDGDQFFSLTVDEGGVSIVLTGIFYDGYSLQGILADVDDDFDEHPVAPGDVDGDDQLGIFYLDHDDSDDVMSD